MKKIVALVLVVSLITPSFAFAACKVVNGQLTGCLGLPDAGTNKDFSGGTTAPNATNFGPSTSNTAPDPSTIQPISTAGIQSAADKIAADRTAQLTDAGQQVGCASDGEFGGAVANALGVALQNIVTGTLLGKFNEIGNKIAQKAGPFGPLVSKAFNVLGGIAATKINNAIGGVVQKITGQIGGVADKALSQVGTALGLDLGSIAGSGAGGILSSIGGVIPGVGVGIGASVPVNEIGAQLSETKAIHKLNTSIDHHADQQEQTAKALAYKECVSDPLVAKIKNALLSFITRSLIDWVNGGFNGGDTAFIQNLQQFLHEGINAATQDFIENQTSGICTPYRQEVQRIILTQYQYNTNYGKRSQCGLSQQQQARVQANEYDQQAWWAGLVNSANSGFGSAMLAADQQRQKTAEHSAQTILDFVKNEGYKDVKKCTDNSQAPPGGYCDGNSGEVVTPGTHIKEAVDRKLGLADQQLINADEIGEIIDALMQGLTQVAFQGVDGLLGLSKKSGTQGSYLDQAVAANVGDAGTSVQNILTADLQGALATEEEYHNTLALVVTDLTNARKGYSDVIACYQPLTTGGNLNITSQTALDTVTLASTTIAQVITPQLTEFTHQLTDSAASIEQLQNLIGEAQAAVTVADYNGISVAFTALKQSGTLHNATDLNYLLTGLETGGQTLEALLQDANTRLAVCHAQ